jgi:RHS repeat-associated protein
VASGASESDPDEDGSTTEYYPDADANVARRGRRRSVTNAAGHTVSLDDYDVYGSARRMVDANGVVSTSVTDARGRTTSSTNHAVAGDANETESYTSTKEYDGRDRLVRTTTPRGHGMRYVYEDATDHLVDTIRLDADGNEVERQHRTLDDVGNTTVEEDQRCTTPAGVCSSWVTRRRVAYAYDKHNRLKELRHGVPAGAMTVYGYDPDGLLASVQDENHTSPNTRYTYDALKRLITVTQSLAGAPGGVAITRSDYDAMDNLVSVTDPNGTTTHYTYDDFGRMTRQAAPMTGITLYRWDAASNLVSSTDARGAVTERTYDALGRVLKATTTLGSSAETVTYAYDDATPGVYGRGRISSMSDPSGMTAYRYDRRGLVEAETRTILGDTYGLEYRHDANGNRTGITYPSGRRLTYAFDDSDRPRSVSGTLDGVSKSYIADAEYEPLGPPARLAYGDGMVERRAVYDLRYRLTALSVLANGHPLADYRYGHDATGNIIAINDALDPRYNRSFGCDDLNRLVTSTTGSALWGSASWTYDPAGNRLASTVGPHSSSFAYAVSTTKLLSATERGRTRAVAYDPAGNEQLVGASAVTYSPRNSLATADGLRYVYDGSGTRVAQVGLAVGPIITQHPESQAVCPGAAVTVFVRASGANAYQWETSSDGTSWIPVPNATSSILKIDGATAYYRVVIWNAAGSTTSDPAAITATALAVEPVSNLLYGDVTRDGSVNFADANVLRAIVAGKQVLPVPRAVADVNGDGRLDALDLALVTAYATSGIACLPQFTTSSASSSSIAALASVSRVPQQTALHPTQYFFYSPEKNLLSHTAIHAGGGRPAVSTDYIWFGGMPVAEETLAPAATHFTFSDYLGTPFMQADLSGTVTWRVEYEPFGDVWSARAGDIAAQRLRFPGQEYDEQTPERAYNIFRWYRQGWGRYSQSDPLGRAGDRHAYTYGNGNPLVYLDALGLKSRKSPEQMDCCELMEKMRRLTEHLDKKRREFKNSRKALRRGTKVRTTAQLIASYATHITDYAHHHDLLEDVVREYEDRCGPPTHPALKEAQDTLNEPYGSPGYIWENYKRDVTDPQNQLNLVKAVRDGVMGVMAARFGGGVRVTAGGVP